MNRVPIILAVIAVFLLLDCKHATKDDPWPVWILYVHPVETLGFSGQQVPVQGCASVVWNYTGDSQTHTENCYQGNSYVKVWNRISEQVNITYFVRCSGYVDSAVRTAFFMPPGQQGQGREGAEVIVNETVVLQRR